MGPYSFRVTVTSDGQAEVGELTGSIPPGVYQVSGAEGSDADTHAHTVSVVQHDQAGKAVVGASGYGQ